jgi:FKBP-type peptidyl-prolyl cis-trans isomerase FklB
MKHRVLFVLIASVLASASLPLHAAGKAELKSDLQKNSYSVGYDVGRALKRQIGAVDANAMSRGMKDALSDTKPALPEQEIKDRFLAQKQEAAKIIPERNKKAGEAFLAKNKTEKGVTTTASGLQYKVLTAGSGAKPTADDTVTVNYRGTLIDGTEFDSSYKRGQPATFPVKGVIPGWTEALQLMGVGAKWQIYLPSNIAYGEHGAGNLIGPNSALIFEVELMSIAEPAAKK